MTAATYTASTFAHPVKANHTGLNTVSGQYTGSANSSGDVIFLAKIPHQAVVVDFAVDHSSAETTFGMKYGLASGAPTGGGASASVYSPSLAKATAKTRWTAGTIALNTQRTTSADPWRISCSDADTARYGIFAAKIATASATTTYVVNYSVTYRMDDPQS